MNTQSIPIYVIRGSDDSEDTEVSTLMHVGIDIKQMLEIATPIHPRPCCSNYIRTIYLSIWMDGHIVANAFRSVFSDTWFLNYDSQGLFQALGLKFRAF